MPTIITHAAVPLIVGQGLRPNHISMRLLLFCVLCAALPDFDVIGFKFGIAYGDAFGHRGASHSLAMACACGAVGLIFCKLLKSKPLAALALPMLAVLTHIFSDMLTNGGLGVALFFPLDNTRYFLPWRPINVSPFGLSALLSARGLKVFSSEALYVWAPSIVAMMMLKVSAVCAAHRRTR